MGKNTQVGLRRLGPTRNSGETHHHMNHNVNSNVNGRSAHKTGKRGTEANNNIHPKFRNNRVPLCHQLPGHNFGGVFTSGCTIIGMRRLGHFRSGTIMSPTTLMRTNVLGGILSNIHVLNGKRLAGTLSMETRKFAGSTRRGVRTTNKGMRIV